MKTITKALTVMMMVLFLAACGGGGDKITISSLTYTETKILAEMYKELIEQETDLEVEMKHDIATSPVVIEGMQSGDIDISTQFTGTSVSSFEEIENPQDSEATLQQMKDLFAGDDFKLEVLGNLGYANTYVFTVREDLAEEYGLENVSDVAEYAEDFSAGFDTAWLEREDDGYPAFKETYGFEFGETSPMEISLVYDAVKNEEFDIVLAYSTDPRIVSYNLQMLEDDESFFPPYDAVPVVREEVLDENPEIKEALEPLLDAFDEEEIAALSGKVDNDGEEVKDVAIEYLKENGLIE